MFVEGAVAGDFSHNFRGGREAANIWSRYLLDLRIIVDTKTVFDLPGGTFSINFQNQGGQNGSDQLGDLQGSVNADADGRLQISEVWYEQLMLDNRLRVKVGKIDANTEFAFPEFGGEFINSSFGYSPTITGLPTYPDPATGIMAFVYPTPTLYAGLGVFDGSGNGGTRTGSYGPARIFHEGRSFFTIGEVGLRWQLAERTLPGRVAVGAHYHDGDFATFDGGLRDGAAGFYALAEQKLWHQRFYDKENENGVYAFLQYGRADDDVSEVSDHFGGGVSWVGPYRKTYPDTVGIGATTVRTSDAAGLGEDFESSIELFYNYQVTPYPSIKPDLQYIVHPGADAGLDDALVATLRVTVAF